jgi:hypothetical protein
MTKIKLIAALFALFTSTACLLAQSGTNPPSITSGLLQIGSAIYNDAPTNLGFYPYGTYVLSAKKAGGGLALVYNVNPDDAIKVGVLAGVDYIDRLLGVNGGVQLSLPIHPLAAYGNTNFALVPLAISAIGTPLQGTSNNDGIETINSVGLALEFGHFLGGRFSLGGLYGTRTGAGAYNGGYLNGFLGWQKKF